MKIGSYTKLEKCGCKPGDEVWACAFSFTYDKESMRYSQRPVRGILACSNKEVTHNALMAKGSDYTGYFVPYGAKGKLSWSKAVSCSARKFATTEQECIEMYNDSIRGIIDSLKKQEEELESELISI